MNPQQITSIKKAGAIVREVREYAGKIIKKDMLLLDIAEQIERKIIELGGKPAFPCNLGINEYTAHYSPNHNDKTKASGLLKIDFGVAINGYTADNAFSVDLENNEENKKLIQASEKALNEAIESIQQNKTLGEIGKSIQNVAEKSGFSPIRNLSGHSIEQNDLHAGITIPNYDNGNRQVLKDGIYAIEPFVTIGMGIVYDGKPSGIYQLQHPKNVRDSKTREILSYIIEEYSTLPFCSRWLVKKFGTRALISLSLLEHSGVLHHYAQLIERSKAKVAQTEHTILINNGRVEVIS